MDSRFGALRSLSLPFGATTGQRIVLNGDTGTIQIFNSSNQEVGRIDPTGVITITDPSTNASITLTPGGPIPKILMRPKDFGIHAIGAGAVFTDEQTVPDRARLVLVSAQLDSRDKLQLTLEEDTGNGPSLYVSNESGGNNANLQVFGDLQVGSGSVPRGPFTGGCYGTVSGTVVLSTTAGTYTAILGNAVDLPLLSGRTYRISFWNEGTGGILVSGSGFSTSDQWLGKFQFSTNGGSSFSDIGSPKLIGRNFPGAATRIPVPYHFALYKPGSNQNTRFQYLITKGAGASTVTSQIEGDHFILIEDAGDQITP